jgi:hypothetical protein
MVDVISIHGMCTHDRDWVVKTAKRLGVATGLSYEVTNKPAFEVNHAGIWIVDYKDRSGALVIRDYAVLWSPLTLNEKRQALCYDASVDTESCPKQYVRERANINSKLKSNLMNDCFADAIIYLGPQGEHIRKTFRMIIAEISAKRQSAENPLFFVTESLGSKVLADSVTEDEPSLKSLVSTKQIFMAANQIPILDLADGEGKNLQGGDSIDQLRREIKRVRLSTGAHKDEKDAADGIIVVAFSDPNDLLSYEAPHPADDRVNVVISIDKTYFGEIEDPVSAHRGYLDNQKVWMLIACGRDGRC